MRACQTIFLIAVDILDIYSINLSFYYFRGFVLTVFAGVLTVFVGIAIFKRVTMPRDQIFGSQSSSSTSVPPAQPRWRRITHHMTSAAGFTLVELVVVTGIIGILATLSIPTYETFVDRAKNGRAKSEVRLLETEINAYRFDIGVFPASLAAIHRDGLLDPWGNAYVYSATPVRVRYGNPLNNDFDLWSKGKDGLTPADGVLTGTGENDLVRAINGIFVGVGEDY